MLRLLALLPIPLLLAACAAMPVLGPAPRDESIVLLPGADGRTGALTVTHAGHQQTLSTPYETANVRQEGRIDTGTTTADAARATFGAALDAQPPRPVKFTLYFLDNSEEFTPASKVEITKILPEIAAHPAPEIVVVGHTDMVGGLAYNDALSLRRAERVRTELVSIGIPAERIQVAGRGKREPLVRTPDETPEPRNRRVDITVR